MSISDPTDPQVLVSAPHRRTVTETLEVMAYDDDWFRVERLVCVQDGEYPTIRTRHTSERICLCREEALEVVIRLAHHLGLFVAPQDDAARAEAAIDAALEEES